MGLGVKEVHLVKTEIRAPQDLKAQMEGQDEMGQVETQVRLDPAGILVLRAYEEIQASRGPVDVMDAMDGMDGMDAMDVIGLVVLDMIGEENPSTHITGGVASPGRKFGSLTIMIEVSLANEERRPGYDLLRPPIKMLLSLQSLWEIRLS